MGMDVCVMIGFLPYACPNQPTTIKIFLKSLTKKAPSWRIFSLGILTILVLEELKVPRFPDFIMHYEIEPKQMFQLPTGMSP
jgi:hypothetical protein